MFKTRLSKILAAIFIFATIMGPGPGLYLIMPKEGESSASVVGIPILYAWVAFWFFVQAGVILMANFKLWSKQSKLDE